MSSTKEVSKQIKSAVITILFIRDILPQRFFAVDLNKPTYEWELKDVEHGLNIRFLLGKLHKDLPHAIKHQYNPAIILKVMDEDRTEFEKWTLKINHKFENECIEHEILMEAKATIYETRINDKKIIKDVIRKRIGWKLISKSSSNILFKNIVSISKSMPTLNIEHKRVSFTILYDVKTPKNYMPPTMRSY